MKNSENEIREIEQLKTTVMPDNFWQDSNYFRVRGTDAIHKPAAYFIDISPAYDF